MCNRQRRGAALRFPDFVENACCNPCCDNAVQATVVSGVSDTTGCCCCGCCCNCCGNCGNVAGTNSGCPNRGSVAGVNTGCRCGEEAAGNVCDVRGIWNLPPRRPCGWDSPFCPCDPDRFFPVVSPTPEPR